MNKKYINENIKNNVEKKNSFFKLFKKEIFIILISLIILISTSFLIFIINKYGITSMTTYLINIYNNLKFVMVNIFENLASVISSKICFIVIWIIFISFSLIIIMPYLILLIKRGLKIRYLPFTKNELKKLGINNIIEYNAFLKDYLDNTYIDENTKYKILLTVINSFYSDVLAFEKLKEYKDFDFKNIVEIPKEIRSTIEESILSLLKFIKTDEIKKETDNLKSIISDINSSQFILKTETWNTYFLKYLSKNSFTKFLIFLLDILSSILFIYFSFINKWNICYFLFLLTVIMTIRYTENNDISFDDINIVSVSKCCYHTHYYKILIYILYIFVSLLMITCSIFL